MKIGIPRALFFYHYYPLWKTFFKSLGQEVILSNPTNKEIMKKGVELAVDDACLPVKIFHGHVMELAESVDVIFLPRIISIEPREYICPKFLGLPDMIRYNLPNLPPLIDVKLDVYKKKSDIFEHFFEIGRILGKSKMDVLKAYFLAHRNFRLYRENIRKRQVTPYELLNQTKSQMKHDIKHDCTVLLLGHPYNLYDNFISMNLIKKLRKNHVKIITYEMVNHKDINKGTKKLSKDMFWTLGRNILGCAYYYLENKKIDGIIHVASFGCGPDSLVGELLERKVMRDYRMPFLYLTLDEHSGEAGFNTRLEAFLDILEGRKISENHFSTHG